MNLYDPEDHDVRFKECIFFLCRANYLESTLPCPLVLYMNILCCYGNVNCCDSPCLTVDLIIWLTVHYHIECGRVGVTSSTGGSTCVGSFVLLLGTRITTDLEMTQTGPSHAS